MNRLTPVEMTRLRFVAKGIWDEEVALHAFNCVNNGIIPPLMETCKSHCDRFDCLYRHCYQFSRVFARVDTTIQRQMFGQILGFGMQNSLEIRFEKCGLIIIGPSAYGAHTYQFTYAHDYDAFYMSLLKGKYLFDIMRAYDRKVEDVLDTRTNVYFIMTKDGMQFPFYHKFSMLHTADYRIKINFISSLH